VDFDLTAEQELIRDTVRSFARERVAPVAAELDLEGRFPYELVSELGGGLVDDLADAVSEIESSYDPDGGA
jgi:alkylation response protein AidB-like acyl-CoA dehydrogenase